MFDDIGSHFMSPKTSPHLGNDKLSDFRMRRLLRGPSARESLGMNARCVILHTKKESGHIKEQLPSLDQVSNEGCSLAQCSVKDSAAAP